MKKLLILALVLLFVLAACASPTPSPTTEPPADTDTEAATEADTEAAGNVHEGNFYRITLPEGWDGGFDMFSTGDGVMLTVFLHGEDGKIDNFDELDEDALAETFYIEDTEGVSFDSAKVGGYDAYKLSGSSVDGPFVFYLVDATHNTVMVQYVTNTEIDADVIAAIESMEIFELQAGDNGANGGWEDPAGNPDPEMEALMDQLLDGIDEVPISFSYELTPDNINRFMFIDYIPGSRGVASLAQIDVFPHMVSLLELPEGADVAAIAAEIEANADPGQWICVGAEKLGVFVAGRYIVMAMSYEAVVDGVEARIGSVLS